MKSLKVKLFSMIAMFVIALSMLIIGVWAIGETQTITMNGSVNFEIADKSLYVKDVRMQEDVNSAPYSLKEQGKFMPGFINGNFDMNLGDFTNNYGSFALYFDIINTMDETTSETFAYTVDQPTAPSGTTVSVSILGTDGTTLEQIPQGTVKPSQITDSTLVTATIKLTIASTSSSSVDLSGITITINQYVPPEVYDYFTFDINEDNQTVTLTDYDPSLSDITDISIPAMVDLVDGVWQDGFTYTVTAIASVSSYSNGVFYDSEITSIKLPSTLQSIGNHAFQNCYGLTGELNLGKCTNLTSIGDYAFASCERLTGELDFSNCTSLTSIGGRAFYGCSGLTGELNLGKCTNLTSIGDKAFHDCRGLTSVDLNGCTSLISIGVEAFRNCRGLVGDLDLSNCTSLTSIGDKAFHFCRGLTSITLPSSLTDIGSSAFLNCTNLTEVIIDGEYVYTNATSASACGSLLSYATTVKVLTSLVSGSHAYINSTNFPSVITEAIGGKNYTVYSK